MKILLLSIGHFADCPGGMQRFVQDEALALRDRGDEVWVLAPGSASQPEHELRHGIHLLRYVPHKLASWNPARGSSHQKAIRGVLMRNLPRVDKIHGHAPLQFIAALDFYGSAIPSVYDVHSPVRMEMAIVWAQAGLMKRLAAPAGLIALNAVERACLRRAGLVTAKSHFTANCLTRIHGRRIGARVRVFPGWADASRFVPVDDRPSAKAALGWPAGVPILFTLRRLVPRMGIHSLLEAAHILVSEGLHFHLMIGGNGPLRAGLEQRATQLGLCENITFLGRLDDTRLPLAYAACDAFVLPTTELECFGIIAVEALLAGRPVLATPVGAIPEIVSQFEPAWLARSAGSEDLAALIRRYLHHELPEHDAAALHAAAQLQFGSNRALPAYLKALYDDAPACRPLASAPSSPRLERT